MAVKYQFNTPANGVYIPTLAQEIAVALPVPPAPALENISVGTEPGKTDLYFASALDAAQQVTAGTVVAATSGTGIISTLLAAERLVLDSPFVTQNTWETLDGAVTSPSFFDENLSQLFGRFTGQCKTVDAGAQLQMLETKEGLPDVVMTVPPFDVPDTGGDWEQFSFGTNAVPRAGQNTYLMQGQLVAATSLELRYLSMSLLRVVVV